MLLFSKISASIVEGQKGIIPRAIQEIFQTVSENPSIDFDIKVSYIEVYKEELRDLLELEPSMKDLHIREDEKGNTGEAAPALCLHWRQTPAVLDTLQIFFFK